MTVGEVSQLKKKKKEEKEKKRDANEVLDQ
jgi:hypothetical protein